MYITIKVIGYEIKGVNSFKNKVKIGYTNFIDVISNNYKMPEKIIIEAEINGITHLFLNGYLQENVILNESLESNCYYFTVDGVVYYFKPILKF
jgi:hypothetical protein